MKNRTFFLIGFMIGFSIFQLCIALVISPHGQPVTHNLIPDTPLEVLREEDGVMYSQDYLVRYTSIDISCLTANIFFEGRNQSLEGQMLIAKTVINRFNDTRFKSTICGVITDGRYKNGKVVKNKCHYSWYCDGVSDRPNLNNKLEFIAWGTADKVALGMLSGDLTYYSTATHYHTSDSTPNWMDSPKMIYLATVDNHLSYLEI